MSKRIKRKRITDEELAARQGLEVAQFHLLMELSDDCNIHAGLEPMLFEKLEDRVRLSLFGLDAVYQIEVVRDGRVICTGERSNTPESRLANLGGYCGGTLPSHD